MPRLFLHIGYPKTGTTGLQRFLASNQAKLRERGILYPEAGKLFHQDIKRHSDAHYATTFALGIGSFASNLTFPTPDEQRSQLAAEVGASGCGTVLMSSEYFITSRKLELVRSFFDGYDVTVIVYLRRHDHAYESSYNQALKNAMPTAWNKTIEAFILYQMGIPDVPYNYFETLERWSNHFGRTNIVIRPFEKTQNQPDIFADFLKVLGLEDAGAFQRPSAELNSSLSHKTLCAIRAVRGGGMTMDKKNRLIQRLLNSVQTGEPPRYLSPPMRNAILALHRPSYVAIARKYLSRENGLLFEERWPTKDDAWNEPIDPTPEELSQMILRAETPPSS